MVAHILRLLVFQDNTVGTVQRNQQTILKALMEAEESAPGTIRARDIFTGHSGRKHRDHLVKEEEFKNEFSRIQYHLETLRTAIHCAKGKDLTRKAELRMALFGSSMSADDVFEVLLKKKLPLFYRTVYLQLFTEVYVDDKANRIILLESKQLVELLQMFLKDVQEFSESFLEMQTPSASHPPVVEPLNIHEFAKAKICLSAQPDRGQSS